MLVEKFSYAAILAAAPLLKGVWTDSAESKCGLVASNIREDAIWKKFCAEKLSQAKGVLVVIDKLHTDEKFNKNDSKPKDYTNALKKWHMDVNEEDQEDRDFMEKIKNAKGKNRKGKNNNNNNNNKGGGGRDNKGGISLERFSFLHHTYMQYR